jgi:ABC-type Fe3+ transport system permease subunit
LFYQSFNTGKDSFYKALKLLQPTFVSSISLAFISALILVFIGFTIAYFSQKNKRISNYFDWLLLLSFAIPSTIFGISLIKFYNHTTFNFIYSSVAIILIAFVGKFAFIAVKLINNGLKQIPKSLNEVGKIQGISTFSRLKNIIFPLLLPSILVLS